MRNRRCYVKYNVVCVEYNAWSRVGKVHCGSQICCLKYKEVVWVCVKYSDDMLNDIL